LEIVRYLLGSLYLLGALIHITLLTNNPDFYRTFADSSLLPFYKTFFAENVAVNPAAYVIPVALFELAIGLLILFGFGRLVTIGLIGGVIFNALIAPLGWWGFLNVLLVALQAFMLTRIFRRSLLDVTDPNPLLP
jgi:hypothetical protein